MAPPVWFENHLLKLRILKPAITHKHVRAVHLIPVRKLL